MKKSTEMRNPLTKHIDKFSTLQMLDVISKENMNSVLAVDRALSQIAAVVDASAKALEQNGRIIYVGCGTSGRTAVADAAECPPTYGVNKDTVTAIMAGGAAAIVDASEGAEDSEEKGREDLLAKNITSNDIVMGISASGNAGYIVSALNAAKEKGCKTVAISCNRECKIAEIADYVICTETGPEVITGSTRMKAGNAQKMVLNMISTCAMVKTGKVYENMMVNLKPTNVKLRRRMIEIVMEILGTDDQVSEKLLEENEFSIPKAIEAYKMA